MTGSNSCLLYSSSAVSPSFRTDWEVTGMRAAKRSGIGTWGRLAELASLGSEMFLP